MPWKNTLEEREKKFEKAYQFNYYNITKFAFDSWIKSIALIRVEEETAMAQKNKKADENYRFLLKT